MRLLIKGSFWFGLVLVLLPLFSSESSTRLANDPQVQFSDAFTAVSGAYDYITGMCGEKPEVCSKGGETLTALGYRAREGARVAYQLIDSQLSGDEDKPSAGVAAVARLYAQYARAGGDRRTASSLEEEGRRHVHEIPRVAHHVGQSISEQLMLR